MEMEITLPGGDRVNARFEGITVVTDQDESAPDPFDLFLASIGTCAGLYVARFCAKRGIPTDAIRLILRTTRDAESRMVRRIEIRVELPEEFPARYRAAVVRAAEQCTVKRHLADPPEIEVRTAAAGSA